MKYPKPLIYPYLCLLSLFFYSSLSSDLVHQACQKLAHSDPKLNYDFCVASLESDPKSPTVSLEELGAISVMLTISNATYLQSYIFNLLEDIRFDPYSKACLKDCLELYSDAIDTLRVALDHFKTKHYSDAKQGFSSAMDASDTCEEGFMEKKGEASPLTKEDDSFFQLCAMDLAFGTILER
ncbi:hypothetical protein AAG906_035247 [Vitis piasezkii]